MHIESRYYCGIIGLLLFSVYGYIKQRYKIMVIGINCILYHILFPENVYVCLYDIVYNLFIYLNVLIQSYKKIDSLVLYLIYNIFVKWIRRNSVTKETQHKHIFEVHIPGLLILMYLL